tara:strand:- start:903 stop:1577 length:675 start_codon:yes stop_codon:yes gene_type:complete
MNMKEQKLMAARLLLGDALAKELVDDQWNAVNDLSDPWEIRDNTTRCGMRSAQLAAKVLHAVTEGLHEHAHDLGSRKQAAFNALSDEERKAWLDEGGEAPASYATEVCADFEGPEPQAFLTDLLKDNAHKEALLAERYDDAKLVDFSGGTLSVKGSVVPVIVETLAQCLGHGEPDTDVANYVEMKVNHAEIGELIVTIQRQSGKTPHELRREAEAKLAKIITNR